MKKNSIEDFEGFCKRNFTGFPLTAIEDAIAAYKKKLIEQFDTDSFIKSFLPSKDDGYEIKESGEGFFIIKVVSDNPDKNGRLMQIQYMDYPPAAF